MNKRTNSSGVSPGQPAGVKMAKLLQEWEDCKRIKLPNGFRVVGESRGFFQNSPHFSRVNQLACHELVEWLVQEKGKHLDRKIPKRNFEVAVSMFLQKQIHCHFESRHSLAVREK